MSQSRTRRQTGGEPGQLFRMDLDKLGEVNSCGFNKIKKTPTYNKMVDPGLCIERTNQATTCELKKN